MFIGEATESDLNDVLLVESLAFGHDKESKLVKDLLDDHSAKPVLSLLAFKNDRAVGHILFTTAKLSDPGDTASIQRQSEMYSRILTRFIHQVNNNHLNINTRQRFVFKRGNML